MSSAAKVLYIIAIVLCALTVISSITTVARWDVYSATVENLVADLMANESAANQTIVKDTMDIFVNFLHIALFITIGTGIISVGVAIYGLMSVKSGKLESVPHILAIVFGVLGGGLVLLIAGIVALVANSKEKNERANDPAVTPVQ